MSWSPPRLRPQWEEVSNPSDEALSELVGATVLVPWPIRTQESAAIRGRVEATSRGYGRTILHVRPTGGLGIIRVSRWRRCSSSW